MKPLARHTWTAVAALWLVFGAGLSAAQTDPAALRGVAVDTSGAALPGATVTLTPEDGSSAAPLEQVTDGAGRFAFEDLAPGRYTVVLALEGFEDRRLSSVVVPSSEELRAALEIAGFAETVLVRPTSPLTAPATPVGQATIEQKVLSDMPLATERFEDALPLLPGVVRGPDGLLNMNGARADQSAFLMNGVNMVDPVTGHFGVRLPLDAIETLNVHAGVHSAAYGGATGSVTDVIIRPGQDRLDVQVQNFLPRLRVHDGEVRGLAAFTPRFRISGPITPGRLWYSQSATYRFVRTRVDELAPLDHSEQVVNSFTSVTQFDARAGDAHHLTATFVLFPSDIDNASISTVRPFDATPDLSQHGWTTSMSDRTVLSSSMTLSSSLAVKQYDMNVQPKSGDAPAVTVSGVRGRYFNHFDRDSTRYDAASTLAVALPHAWGQHLVRTGGQLAHTSYDGVDSSAAVSVLRGSGSLLRQITYLGTGRIGSTNTEAAAFAEDEWAIGSRLTLQGGARYAYDAVAGQHTLAPRVNAALHVSKSGRTVVKGGIGRLYDKLPLNASDFESQQSRRIVDYDASGVPVSAALLVNHAGDLRLPRSTTENIEIDQMLTPRLLARVGYRRTSGADQLIVDPRLSEGALVLSSTGRSRSQEFEATVRRQFENGSQVTASYVRSKTTGDLNAFVTLFGDLRDPVILPNQYSRQPFDVPNRVLVWGVVMLPHGITAAPTIEYRNGFPFTVVDDTQQVVGVRNEGGRFPDLFTLDLAVTKDVRLTRTQRARVGIQVFNLTNHFNPQDVQSNLASPLFGRFANSIERQVRLKFTFLF